MTAVIEQRGTAKAYVTCTKATVDEKTDKKATELVAAKKMEGGYYDVYCYRFSSEAIVDRQRRSDKILDHFSGIV